MRLKIFIIALIALFSFNAFAQDLGLPRPKDVPREYRSEYRRLLREYKQRVELRENWDIVIDPIEAIPTRKFNFSAAENSNWGQRLLLPVEVWQQVRARATAKVVIKIADTGEAQHSDLERGLIAGSNYTTDGSRFDGHGHSTHVGGIIAAKGFGLADPLFDKGLAQIKYCKVLSDNGSGSFNWISNMITTEDAENRQLIASGTKVIVNMSLGGGTSKVSTIESALQSSTSLGVVYCVAAGNTGGPVNYPGNSVYVTGVSSLDENLTLSSYSCRGPEVEHTAPGRNIYSTYKGNTYATLSGTSMATPFQTALTAIAMSIYPTKLVNQATVDVYFKQIGVDMGAVGKDDLYGYGLVYVKAILANEPGAVPPPSPTCVINSITFVGTPSSCNDNGTPTNIADDYFTQSVKVVFTNKPATGSLIIVPNGDQIGTYMVPVADIGTEYTFANVKFRADGTPTNISVNFTALPTCSLAATGPIVRPCGTQPPPDTLPVRPVRSLMISMIGNYQIVWTVSGNSATVVNFDAPLLFDFDDVTATAFQTLTITNIDVVVSSTTSADIEYNRLKANLAWFFKNRGLGLPKPADFADATYWTAYFFDMLLNTQAPIKQDITVLRISGRDSFGNEVFYTDKTLRPWIPK